MPGTETKTTGNRGRPRKSVAAVRKVPTVSHDDDDEVMATNSNRKYVKHNDNDDKQVDELEREIETDENEGMEQDEDVDEEVEEPDEQPPAFSLATLGLQRVGSAPPPKPKCQKAPILTLNARGMPARIRKRNPLFYDENIINDDKPLRVSLAPKKLPARGVGDSPGKLQTTPSKVLKKRKGVVSRYMRSNDNGSGGSTSNSATSTDASEVPLKHRKTPGNSLALPSTSSGVKGQQQLPGAMRGRAAGGGAKIAAAAAAMAAAEDAAKKAEAQASANKRLGQSIGIRLRNLLKLPKAHKWAIAEWFYSYIDKPLFDCKYDFMNHVNELTPRLGTRRLNRHEWVNIRRRMGRPRRCSAAFFSEERRELERKRQLMRTLQSRKPGELKDSVLLADMPEKIPMPLPLGTKVTARLRTPQDGIFAGTVAAYDSLNAMYRVTFERLGLGTQSIPDYEIVSENFHEMLPLHSFTKDFRPNLMSIYQTNNMGFTTNLGFTINLASSYHGKRYPLAAATAGNLNSSSNNSNNALTAPQKHLVNNNAAARNALSMKLNKSDPLLGQDAMGESPMRQQLARHHGYPMKLLEHLVLLQNYIALKEARIHRLSEMNAKAELAMGELMGTEDSGDRNRRQLRDDFQRRYASNILRIEHINGNLMYELTKVQELSSSLTRNPNIQAMISPTLLREECRAKASQTVDEMNKGVVKSERMVTLLKNLTTLLIVTQNLDSDWEAAEVNKVLEGCMEEVRSNLVCNANSKVFQKSVQSRLEYIALDINRNIEERSFSQASASASAKSPKSPKSEATDTAGETASTKATNDDKKKNEKEDNNDDTTDDQKEEPQAKNKKDKSKQDIVESDVEPMDVDSEPEHEDDDGHDAAEVLPAEQKKKQADGDEDETEADADADADHDVDADDSDATEKRTNATPESKVDATNADPCAEDSQITIESMKESDDESQTQDEKDDDKQQKSSELKLVAETEDSDSQQEFNYEK